MRRTVLLFAAIAAVFLAAACSNRSDAQAASTLSTAFEKTLAADGFHIQGSFASEGETVRSEGDYVAPDRLSMFAAEGTPGAANTIIVGRNHYSTLPDDLDTFTLWEMPCDFGLGTIIPALDIVPHAQDVQRDGDTFTFTTDDDSVEGHARVEGEYLVELTVRYPLSHIDEPVEERWVFSDFGTTAQIEPPPAERVIREPVSSAAPGVIVVDEGSPAPCP